MRMPISCIFLFLFSISTPVLSENSQALPLEYFASLPDVSSVQLSPNGELVASFIRVADGKKNGKGLVLNNLEKGTSELLLFAEDNKYTFSSFQWASNEYILVHASFPEIRSGTETREHRLFVVNTKTKKNRSLLTKKIIKTFGNPQIQTHIIDILPNEPDHILLALTEKHSIYKSVFKVPLKKGKLKKVQHRIQGSFDWVTDRDSNIRIVSTRFETTYRIRHRPLGSEKWDTLWEFEAFSREQVWPLGFGASPNELYVTALHEGRNAVFLVDLDDPKLTKTLVYSDKNYDVDGSLIYSKKSKSVVGLSTDVEEHIFWDDSLLGLNNGLNKALPDTFNHIVSMSDDENKYILYSTSATDPGAFFIGDRNKKTLSPIAYRYAKLTPGMLADKHTIHYKARDGLQIQAYLTFPKGKEKNKNLPTVIFPHGGPISHDSQSFDYWTQFFANRGYIVLQMNFRGSSGYGYDFMAAGLKGWGKAMQNDVEDGVRWMIEQGYTDPNRICIAGGSYGGYAALMAAANTPELYQCAISFAGVSDLPLLVKSHWRYTNYDIVKEQVGTDFKDMKRRSPYYNAEKIEAPVLLIHGEEDRVVPIKHSRRMHKALKSKKKDVSYIVLKEGSHYLGIQNNRIQTFRAMEEFLAKHLAK